MAIRKTIFSLLFVLLLLCSVFAAQQGSQNTPTAEASVKAKTPPPIETSNTAKNVPPAAANKPSPPSESKPVGTKSGAKPVDTKPVEASTVEVKVDTKPADAIPVDTKISGIKSSDNKDTSANTKPVETKATAQKVETKAKTVPKEKKVDAKANQSSEQKSAPQAAQDGFAVDELQRKAGEYFNWAKAEGVKLCEQVASLAVWDQVGNEYTKYAKITHDNAEKFVDNYLPFERASFLKANFFNIYGLLAFVLIFIALAIAVSKIEWVFTLNPIRAFLSALGLGIFLTLYGLTRLVKDPAVLVAKNSPEAIDNFHIASLVYFGILVTLNFVGVLRGGIKDVLQFIASVMLFADCFGLRPYVESYIGALPPYTFALAVFALFTLLSFSQLETGAVPVPVYDIGYKVKSDPVVVENTPTSGSSPVKEGKKKSRKN